MTKQEEAFISEIAPYIVKECAARGYKYPSAIIAQAILESAWGKSKLAATYHNYFGLKCGSAWRGKSVNLKTKEEYTAGTLTTIKDNFRVYDDMAAGVAGYFDFISTKRYSAAKYATSAKEYLSLIWAAGYATSKQYVEHVYWVIEKYNLRYYDACIGQAVTDVPEVAHPVLDAELDAAIECIARRVIAGRFGNGHEHRASEIYKLVKVKVNELC